MVWIKKAVAIFLAVTLLAAGSNFVFAGGSAVSGGEDEETGAYQGAVPSSVEDTPTWAVAEVLSQEENDTGTVEVRAKSAILMEQSTGKVLFEYNADEQLAPASITKVMTLLLVMEAIEDGKITLEDKVSCSENASSMGGSQIWMEPGEQMTVDELIKATTVASANDAAVALGEHIAGSEEGFVAMMNERAQSLGMNNTCFKNITGLDEEGHYSSARDIAIMSRELIQYDLIQKYSTIWMDSLRGGETQLVNTNKLVRFYSGATGLKTGTTDQAGSCLSATATRGDLSLVAVTLGAGNSDDRFLTTRKLLDYGFANYTATKPQSLDEQIHPVKVLHGEAEWVNVTYETPENIVVKKGDEAKLNQTVTLAEDVQAPVEKGQVVGKVTVDIDGEMVAEYNLKAAEAVGRMSFFKALQRLLKSIATF